MRQVLVIHGGDSFAKYEDFLKCLRAAEVDIEQTGKGWKATLNDTLGEEYQVIAPRMPNSQNARFEEWKIWFEKYLPHMHDGAILIGHSLGGSFLAKYLSESKLPFKALATFLVAPPFDVDGDHDLIEFAQHGSLEGLQTQGGELFLYHSSDDEVVSIKELDKYE